MCTRKYALLLLLSLSLAGCFGAGSGGNGQVLTGTRLFTIDSLAAALQSDGSRVVRGQSYCCGAPLPGSNMLGETATSLFVDNKKLIVVIYSTPDAARHVAETLPAFAMPPIDGQPAEVHVSGNALVLYAGADLQLAERLRTSVRMI
jgi:hypothetical protein